MVICPSCPSPACPGRGGVRQLCKTKPTPREVTPERHRVSPHVTGCHHTRGFCKTNPMRSWARECPKMSPNVPFVDGRRRNPVLRRGLNAPAQNEPNLVIRISGFGIRVSSSEGVVRGPVFEGPGGYGPWIHWARGMSVWASNVMWRSGRPCSWRWAISRPM